MSSGTAGTTRAEARPPRPGTGPEVATAVVAAALLAGLPAVLDDPGRLVAVAALQVALAAAWVRVAGLLPAAGTVGLGVVAAAGADALALTTERPRPGSVLAVLGVGFVAAVLLQMLRGSSRPRLVASLAGSAVLVVAAGAPVLWLVLGRVAGGDRLALLAVVAAAAGVVVAALADAVLPRPALAAGAPTGVTGLVLGVAAGAVAGSLAPLPPALDGPLGAVLAGAGLALLAVLLRTAARFAAVDPRAPGREDDGGPVTRTAGPLAPVLAGALPLALLAPAAYAAASAVLAGGAS